MILYIDSSAFVKRYIAERGSREVDRCLNSANARATAAITRIEVAAVLTRRARGGQITTAAASMALSDLSSDWPVLWHVPVDASMLELAYKLLSAHALKGYDSVQLAAAMRWRAVVGERVSLATFDDQLWSAAQVEGFVAWPSNLARFK